MFRGELWIGSANANFARKPRPFLIVQANHFPKEYSVVACPLTSIILENVTYRMIIKPSPINGLRQDSQLMIEKITHLKSNYLANRIGGLSSEEMAIVDAVLREFLGLETSPAKIIA